MEFPEQGIATYPGCAAVRADAIWKTAKTSALTNYLNTLSEISVSGITLNPDDLLPGWPADGYFKYAYPIYDDKVEHLRIEHKYLYIAAFYQAEEGDICTVALLQSGPNLGSAGGPSLETVGNIATLHYTPQLTTNSRSERPQGI